MVYTHTNIISSEPGYYGLKVMHSLEEVKAELKKLHWSMRKWFVLAYESLKDLGSRNVSARYEIKTDKLGNIELVHIENDTLIGK